MICDFCSSPNPRWSFPAHDVLIPDAGQASEGAWAACDPCAELIDADDLHGLVARTFEHRPSSPVINDVEWLAFLRALHIAFFTARTGPRTVLRG